MSLHLMPLHIPPPSELLPMVAATPGQVARALGVTGRTVYRWLAADSMPRSSALALYWVTPCGWSHVVSDAGHRVAVAEGLADALRRENAGLLARVARLERTGHFGSANSPALLQVGGWSVIGP